MKIVTECNLAEVASEMINGRTVIFPTETTYGLGCDGTNQEAVDNIYRIKGRREDKPLLVIAGDIEMAKKYIVWNDLLEKIAAKYWPGPMTVVANYKMPIDERGLARGVVSTAQTVAVRVSNFSLLSKLSQIVGRPIVSTSANLSGSLELYNNHDILYTFQNQVAQPDIFLDFGVLPHHAPTTIVSVIGGDLKILRQGELIVHV